MDLNNMVSNGAGAFNFSAVDMGQLKADKYTLATIAVDASSSVHAFKDELEKVVETVYEACQTNMQVSSNLLLRLTQFSSNLDEIHGFRLLKDCNAADYRGFLNVGGMTALVDASLDAVEATYNHAGTLEGGGYDSNGILFIITDGGENASKKRISDIVDAIKRSRTEEILEDLTTILVAVNSKDCDYILQPFFNDVGFDHYVTIEDTTPKALALFANWVSQSISSSSQSLLAGTAGSTPIPSQSLSF